MRCIAHRGFAGVNPENTLAAVRRAVAAGADAVEVDARRCGSGEVVVHHDATVDRVTDGHGPLREHSRRELSALQVLDSGEGVPTLAAVLEALPPTVDPLVELKEAGLAGDVAGALADHGGSPLVSAFEADHLRAVARASPAVSLALLGGAERADGRLLDRATALGCTAVHPHHDLCTEAFLARAHDRGLAVNAWTVRDGHTARRLAARPVDGLIADAPRWCEQAGAGPV